ncbi:filamentous hemagglutinin N-terminal domain-containing protein [Oscillatoria sp. FACHB-1406]|uniref:two-partner secretion domain-containing protein n=1 Tax=Oscillatoria sp. FACHB-1406 TaxID=2692846 RepID=UPI00168905E0|nr:filamentous hemagglutinin N-terminal domain-containing protein [Oscillatoria sp. FACHB-1406]MBD2580582.1 filamentous hemagglutinin N-terminal domain-containing protein [Oscillatoria sp. FACHB-1406]
MNTSHQSNLFVPHPRNSLSLVTLLLAVSTAAPAYSQSIVAAPDGTGTLVTIEGDRFNIGGGTRSGDGSNLFQSFAQFGLSTNQIANFLTTPQIQNILARVVGNDPSVINGLIQVTGGNSNLYLMNPAGIIFGNGASLNVGGDFFATTATGIGFGENRWFNAFGDNNYATLTGNPTQFAFDLSHPSAIVNAGNLNVSDGQNVTLLAGQVINTGSITAPNGNIAIAAVPGSSLIKISQPGSLLSLEVAPPRDSNGAILPFSARDLPQLLAAANGETGLVVDANRRVYTAGGTEIPPEVGTAISTGTLSVAPSVSQPLVPSQIAVIGDRVGIVDNATILAPSGNIRIGGDYQGRGNIPNAKIALVGRNATINADAGTEGNGGRVIVWADDKTAFFGTVNARGGSSSGNGGFVEISGKNNLIFDGNADVSAVGGMNGTILFDPRDIIVVSGASAVDDNQLNDSQILAGDGGNADFTISDTKLRSIVGGTIILKANRDITFNSGLDLGNTAANALKANLDLQASQDININSELAFTGNFGLTANAGRNINTTAFLRTNQAGTGNLDLTAAGDITARLMSTGGSINLVSTGGSINIINAGISTNNAQTGSVNLTAAVDINTHGITAGGGIVLSSTGTNGNINVKGRIDTPFNGTTGVQIEAGNTIDLNDTSLGAIEVIGSGGAISVTSRNGNIIARQNIQSNRGNIALSAATSLDVQEIQTSGGDINLSGGNILANEGVFAFRTNPLDPNATGAVTLQSVNNIDAQNINAEGTVTLNSSQGNIIVRDTIDAREDTAAGVNINAAKDVRVETILAGGNVNIGSTTGNVIIGENTGSTNEIRSSSRVDGGTPGRVAIAAYNGTVTLNGLIRAGKAQKTGDSHIDIAASRFVAINPGTGQLLDTVDSNSSTTVTRPTSLFAFPANVTFIGNVNINSGNVSNITPGLARIVFSDNLQNPTATNSSSIVTGSGAEVIRIVLPRSQNFAVGSAFDPNNPNLSGTAGSINLAVAGIPPTLTVLLENASFTPPDILRQPVTQPPNGDPPTGRNPNPPEPPSPLPPDPTAFNTALSSQGVERSGTPQSTCVGVEREEREGALTPEERCEQPEQKDKPILDTSAVTPQPERDR